MRPRLALVRTSAYRIQKQESEATQSRLANTVPADPSRVDSSANRTRMPFLLFRSQARTISAWVWRFIITSSIPAFRQISIQICNMGTPRMGTKHFGILSVIGRRQPLGVAPKIESYSEQGFELLVLKPAVKYQRIA